MTAVTTVTAAFAARVAANPHNTAVIADDGVLTYGELAANAVSVAEAIRVSGGAGPVGVLCRHGATTISAMLGALVAGRAYVPLDPTFPPARLAHQLTDSGTELVLTDADSVGVAASVVGGSGTALVDIDALLGRTEAVDASALVAPVLPDDLAYLLYTSGSTGTPKGVRQSHGNVVFGATNHARTFGITAADRTSVLTSFGFDMAVTDTFAALLSGAAAVPVDIRDRGLAHLAGALAERRVTIYHSTPTVYRYLVASLAETSRLPDIRVVLLGGEEVTARDVRLCRERFGAECVFVNGYGATEVSFIAQHHLPPGAPVTDGVLPIGRPLPGIEVRLVDEAGEPAERGEILVRSKHVALGYHGRAAVGDHKFGLLDGERTYRTGDLARRRADGLLEFLGRADRQVKVRGYRVELGEVESALADLPGVAQAAVVARRSGEELELVGYVVATGALNVTALRTALADRLPRFMVPRAIVTLTELPLTVTGKLDVHALPDPDVPATPEAPDPDGVTGVITRAWCATLGRAKVGEHDNFFELGGHSLQMALVQQRLERELARRVPITELVAHPTIAGLTAHLSGTGTDTDTTGATDAIVERAARRRQARLRRSTR
jgi:amino acid adenylation domain-containing protein